MTCIIDAKWKNARPAKRAAGIALSAFAVLGMFAVSAKAEDGHDNRRDGDRRGEEHRDDRRSTRGYDGGYYRQPAVVYGSPNYYRAPPLIYGPNFGITLGVR